MSKSILDDVLESYLDRLHDAGDKMAEYIEFNCVNCDLIEEWNNAKEDK